MKKIIVGVTGASGAQLAYHMLKALRTHEVEIHLILSEGAKTTILCETEHTVEDFRALSDAFYSETSQIDILSKLGVLAVEMEAAALYINAERAGKNALAMCSISDSLVTGEELPAEERQVGFRNMMELSLSLI